MSLADESFPGDCFLDDVDFSINNGKMLSFPHHYRRQNGDEFKLPLPLMTTSVTTSALTSSSSTTQHFSNASAALSSKTTTTSDPSGLAENLPKLNNFLIERPNKVASFQDQHLKYTKIRYKHVESKVATYIANMKAENQKRNKTKKPFQRHRSMPETWHASASAADSVANAAATIHFSTGELHKLEELTSDAEGDSVENLLGSNSATSSHGETRHETSDDTGAGSNSSSGVSSECVDKLNTRIAQLESEKERIQSYSDYLQTCLDEKLTENLRLKRNGDALRIELSNCQDKLIQQEVQSTQSLMTNSNYGMGGGSVGILRQQSLHSLLYCPTTTKSSAGTQTELVTPEQTAKPVLQPVDIHVTPLTPEPHRNVFDSSEGSTDNCNIATIKPLSLNFSNLAGSSERSDRSIVHANVSNQSENALQTISDNSRNSYPSSSDSAIEMERPSARQQRLRDFVYHNRNSVIETQNAQASRDENELSVAVLVINASPDGANVVARTRRTKKRSRWFSIFRACTRCSKETYTENINETHAQSYTQVPLLNESRNTSL